MPFTALFRRNPHRVTAHEAYRLIVARARDGMFFTELGVPDTLDGRYELIALHVFLLLNRLKADRGETADFAQSVFDSMFADLDRGLREMGAGDLGVGRRVKAMAAGFYGRILAYERGLAAGDAALGDALRRNLYGTVTPTENQLAAMADYLRRQLAALGSEPVTSLLSGNINFVSVCVGK